MHGVAFRVLARSGSASGVLPHSTQDLREIRRTGGVRESELGRIHAICRSIRPRRDRALTIRGVCRHNRRGALSVRRTSPSSEGKAPHEWSERPVFQEPYATSFIFYVSVTQGTTTQPCAELDDIISIKTAAVCGTGEPTSSTRVTY